MNGGSKTDDCKFSKGLSGLRWPQLVFWTSFRVKSLTVIRSHHRETGGSSPEQTGISIFILKQSADHQNGLRFSFLLFCSLFSVWSARFFDLKPQRSSITLSSPPPCWTLHHRSRGGSAPSLKQQCIWKQTRVRVGWGWQWTRGVQILIVAP